jgi:ribosome-associated protein
MRISTALMTKRKPTTRTKTSTSTSPKKAPTKRKTLSVAERCRNCISTALDTNKAEDIVALDVRDKCSFADYMIVATGRGGRHVSALADHVLDALKQDGFSYANAEGQDTGDWVLIDAGNVIVHIFRPEMRQLYNIEKMWSVSAF